MRHEPDQTGYELVYAIPEQRAAVRHLGPEHASFQHSVDGAYRIVSAGDPDFEPVRAESGIKGGSFALLRLGDIGILKLYTHSGYGFTALELKQLCPVVEKFAVSLSGALAHETVVLEHARREKAQRSLARQTALLRSLIDSVPDPIFYKDRDSVYLGCNSAFEVYANRKEEEIVGAPTSISSIGRRQSFIVARMQKCWRSELHGGMRSGSSTRMAARPLWTP